MIQAIGEAIFDVVYLCDIPHGLSKGLCGNF